MSERQRSNHEKNGLELLIAMSLGLATLAASIVPNCMDDNRAAQGQIEDLSDDELGELMYEIRNAREALNCGPTMGEEACTTEQTAAQATLDEEYFKLYGEYQTRIAGVVASKTRDSQ